MIIFTIEPDAPDPAAIKQAAEAILRGELVIFPTETVYGLAASALDEEAVRRVFDAKGREEGRPLPVQVAGLDALAMVAAALPESGRILAEKYWPGPLTLVLPKKENVSELVSAGSDTVGVRVPDHPVALAMLREVGIPIVATSANLSGNPAPACAAEAVRELGDAVAVVLDAGESRIGLASTVIDVTVPVPRILRVGAITVQEIRDILGDIEVIGD